MADVRKMVPVEPFPREEAVPVINGFSIEAFDEFMKWIEEIGENKMERVRGFEVISDYDELPKEERPILPRRQTKNSAGYDFYAVGDVLIPKGWGGLIRTGVKAYMPPDEHLEVHIRSSYGMKYKMRMANSVGIIDADYYNNPDNEGEILVKLINEGDGDIMIRRGDRFAQGIFVRHYFVDDDDADGERTGGVGSSGV